MIRIDGLERAFTRDLLGGIPICDVSIHMMKRESLSRTELTLGGEKRDEPSPRYNS